jgi:V-type H+-transporting ATPase subunit H
LIKHSDPYKPFLPLLKPSSNADDPIPLLTSAVLSSLISAALAASSKPSQAIEEALPQLYSALSTLAKSSDAGLQDIAVQEYSAVVRTKKARELFWKQRTETVDPLIGILRAAAGAGKDTDSAIWSGTGSVRTADTGITGGVGLQLLYHVLLVIWQLSFEGAMVGEGLQEYDLVLTLTMFLR